MSTLTFISAEQQIAEGAQKTSILLVGPPKIGKTSAVLGLDPARTLFLECEAGTKSIEGRYTGDRLSFRAFPDAINVACLLGGPNPAKASDQTFSQAHYDYCVDQLAGTIDPAKYSTLFVDSVTELTRLALDYAKTQPAAFSDRTGRPDLRGAYGLLGREVIGLLKHLQHAPGKTVVFVASLGRRVDDFGREIFEPLTEGAKVATELPFIIDVIVTMSAFDRDPATGSWSHNFGKGEHRAFCCTSPNPHGLPAGDRSGRLDQIEEPHLGRLIEKINGATPAELSAGGNRPRLVTAAAQSGR